jgi:hypothetical protein
VIAMNEDGNTESEDSFIKRLDVENMKYWVERKYELKKDMKREEKGLYYLGLSIVSILGGVSGLVYGLIGKDWIQRPYVILGGLMILFGLSIVIGGFGKVKE